MKKITIKKGFTGPAKYTKNRPDFYIVTNHTGREIRTATKTRANEIAEASRRIREKRR